MWSAAGSWGIIGDVGVGKGGWWVRMCVKKSGVGGVGLGWTDNSNTIQPPYRAMEQSSDLHKETNYNSYALLKISKLLRFGLITRPLSSIDQVPLHRSIGHRYIYSRAQSRKKHFMC